MDKQEQQLRSSDKAPFTRIFKYELLTYPTQYTLPVGATFLTVQSQNDIPHMWFELDPAAPTEQRTFAALATGEPIYMPASQRKYLGTFQLENGTYVFHLFEIL